MNYIGNEPAPGGLILVGDTTPVGTIIWAHKVPDSSYLQLNGQQVLKGTYPDLWVHAQGFLTADQVANPGLYLNVDAASFRVPKFDGLFIRATGQYDANRVAAALGVKQDDGFRDHVHSLQVGGGAGGTPNLPQLSVAAVGIIATVGVSTAGVLASETRPTNVALIACVKAMKSVLIPNTGTLVPLPNFSATLAADVAMNNAANWFDGPSVALGAGTWLVSGTVSFTDSGVAAPNVFARIWDGVTQTCQATQSPGAATTSAAIALSGVVTNPAGAVRIQGKSSSVTSKLMNGNCNITAVKIA